MKNSLIFGLGVIVLSLVVCVPPARASDAINLTTNPDPIHGLAPWKLDHGAGVALPDSTHTGINFLHMTGASVSTASMDITASVKAGASYVVTAQGRLSDNKVKASLGVQFSDAQGKALANAATTAVTSTQFSGYSLLFTVPAQAQQARLVVQEIGKASTDYADVEQTVLTAAPAPLVALPAAAPAKASGTPTVPEPAPTSAPAASITKNTYIAGANTGPVAKPTHWTESVGNANRACGGQTSGTTYRITTDTTTSSANATLAQCPYGGTQSTITIVTQDYNCSNSVLSPVGSPFSTDYTLAPKCNPPPVVNGACGSANGVSTNLAPSTALCTAGTASAVATNGSAGFSWSCEGSGGGTTQLCSAPLTTVEFQKELGERNGLGCYSGGQTGITLATQFYSWLGRSSDFAMDYDWSYNFPDTVLRSKTIPTCWKNAGYTKISWALSPIEMDGGVTTMAAGVAGAYDTYYTQIAQNLINDGYPDAIIRLGWEFNGGWYTWSVLYPDGKANFVPLWQRIVTIMRAVPGAKFTFDWCYSMGSSDPTAFYPGDAYVDYIGADVYDRWWGAAATETPAQRWQLLVNEKNGLQWQADFAAAHNKQISFPEWGLGIGMTGDVGDDPTFINGMYNWIQTHNVAYHDLWNESGDELDIPTTLAPLSAATFKADFGH